MRPLSTEEKKKMLSMISWDLKLDAGLLLKLLNDEIKDIEGFDKSSLYRRLLTTYDWYTLMKIVPPDKLRLMLDDSVLDRLFPKDLKEKFLYARTVLLG
jgi:hypothetical protein